MEKPVIVQKKPYVLDVEPGTYYYCTCGKSSKQPYCDGKHKGSAFAPQKVEIIEARKVAFCGCKHSKKGAFCDGIHVRL